MKEVAIDEKDTNNEEVINEIDKADKKLFEQKKEEMDQDGVVACDACGEIIDDVQLPYTSTERTGRQSAAPMSDRMRTVPKARGVDQEMADDTNMTEAGERRKSGRFKEQRKEFIRVKKEMDEVSVIKNITRELT